MDEMEQMGPPPTFGPPPMPAAAADPEAAQVRRFRRRVVTATCVVAAAAGVGLGATALAGAATSPSTTTPPSQGTPPVPRPAMGGHLRFGGPGLFGLGLGLGGGMVHGQYTIKGPNGYETVDQRSGTVSALRNTSGSTWSLTVKSPDGTSGTFVVNSSTSVDGGESGIGSVKSGDTVTVVGTVSGSTATATQIVDQTVLKTNGKLWLPMPKRAVTPNAASGASFGPGPGAT